MYMYLEYTTRINFRKLYDFSKLCMCFLWPSGGHKGPIFKA